MKIGELWALLGIRFDKGSWEKANSNLRKLKHSFVGVASYLGGRAMMKALVGYNMQIETAKNQIASLMAVTKETSVASELENASKLYDMLRASAAELPGETQDYVNMLALLTQPLTKAKLGLEDMRDITTGVYTLAKGFGEPWQAASRDIREFINFGKINKVDKFVRTLMNPLGYDADEKSRAKLQKMSIEQRAALVKQATASPQVKQMQELMGKSFEGQLDKLKDAMRQFFGLVGKPLFEMLGNQLRDINGWLSENKERLQEIAKVAGEYVKAALEKVRAVFVWLFEDIDRAKSVIYAILTMIGILILQIMGPIVLLTGAISAVIYLFLKLYDRIGPVGAAILTAFAVGGIMKFVGWIRAGAKAWMLYGAEAAKAAVKQRAATAGGFGVAGAGAAGAMGAATVGGRAKGLLGGAMMLGKGLARSLPYVGLGMLADDLLLGGAIQDTLLKPLGDDVMSKLYGGDMGGAMKAAQGGGNVQIQGGPVNIEIHGEVSEEQLAMIEGAVQKSLGKEFRTVGDNLVGNTE